MSNPEGFSDQHVWLAVKRSKIHGVVNLVAHGVAGFALFSNEIFSEPMKFALGFSVFISMCYVNSRYVLLTHPESVKEVTCLDSQWKLRLNNGRQITATLLGPLFASRSFLVLLFQTPAPGVLPVVIGADTVDDDLFRRTRVLIHRGSERLLRHNSSEDRLQGKYNADSVNYPG